MKTADELFDGSNAHLLDGGAVHPSGYTPAVGDKFYKPSGTYHDIFSGAIKDTPERNAEITMLNHNHVVIVIDGQESTMTRSEFIKLAKNTIKSGATLTHRA